jgi:two-component system, chemotaxis family, protein-glutamate methylesterase/glutaminase
MVIGASAGGVEALREVTTGLPRDLAAPVFVIFHIPPYVASSLPHIRSSGPLKAVHPKDGAAIKERTI